MALSITVAASMSSCGDSWGCAPKFATFIPAVLPTTVVKFTAASITLSQAAVWFSDYSVVSSSNCVVHEARARGLRLEMVPVLAEAQMQWSVGAHIGFRGTAENASARA